MHFSIIRLRSFVINCNFFFSEISIIREFTHYNATFCVKFFFLPLRSTENLHLITKFAFLILQQCVVFLLNVCFLVLKNLQNVKLFNPLKIPALSFPVHIWKWICLRWRIFFKCQRKKNIYFVLIENRFMLFFYFKWFKNYIVFEMIAFFILRKYNKCITVHTEIFTSESF